MVRTPLTPDQIAAGRRLGAMLRDARAERTLDAVVQEAGISPETLRKIETGRLPSPAFGTVVALSEALGIALQGLAEVWRDGTAHGGRVRRDRGYRLTSTRLN